jgi:predicted site-specific integrase-resolvase
MPVKIDGVTYYRTKEACDIVGIAKNTYLRWVTGGNFCDVQFRDRRGWRLFTAEEVNLLKVEANKIQNNSREIK